MITLIDRADGTPLCTLSAEDFVVLQDNLERESDQDFDYYLNDPTLEMLAAAGMSEEAVTALSTRMRHRGMDVGWEHQGEGKSFTGRVVDAAGHPLGGVRIDLVSESGILNWTYSRPDGAFAVLADGNVGDFLRFSGRGDLIVREDQMTVDGDQGDFELQTVTGSVKTDDDRPLAGVNVLVADWRSAEHRETASWAALGGLRSWGDTNDDGRFSIPINLPEDVGPLELELELTTVGGQTLETVVLTVGPETGFDLGILRAPDPVVVEEQAMAEEAASIEG